MKRKRFTSVWDAIEHEPAAAKSLELRSSLMLALKRYILREGLTQTEAARVFGVTQPRISNLVHGKINSFGLDLLVRMAATGGLRVSMKIGREA